MIDITFFCVGDVYAEIYKVRSWVNDGLCRDHGPQSSELSNDLCLRVDPCRPRSDTNRAPCVECIWGVGWLGRDRGEGGEIMTWGMLIDSYRLDVGTVFL